MRSYSRVARVLARILSRLTIGICLSIAAPYLALIPREGHAQGAKPKASPMIGGNANVTVSPSSDNVSVSGSSTHTYTFYLGNSGTGSAVAALSIIECTGAVSSCSVSPSSVSLPANGGSGTATVTYHTAATGTGELMLFVNWGSGNNTSATLDVTLPSATPSVTASPTTEWTQQNVSTGFPYFTIQNTGNTAATYNLTASCTNVVVGTCTVVSPTGSVAPNGTTTAEVRFTTNAASSGNATATLTATSPYGEANSQTGTIVPMSEYVTVAGTGAPTPPAPSASATYGFSITATGNNTSTVTYGLTASCSGALSCSTTPSPGSVGISPGNPSNASVVATATSNTAGGAGTVTLTALYTDPWGNPYTGQSTYSVTVPPAPDYTPGVVPSSGETGSLVIGQSVVDTFVVRNQGNQEAVYHVSASCDGAITTTCSLANSMQATVDLLPGETAPVPVHWQASGSATTSHVSLTASYSTWTATGTRTLTTSTWQPSITANGPPSGGFAPDATGLIQSFTVTNTGNSSATYSYGVSCVDAVGEGAVPASCAVVTPAPYTIAAGASATVQVRFNSGDEGTSSTMTLSATSSPYSGSGTATVTINQLPPSVTTTTSSVADFSGISVTRSFMIHNPNAVAETYSWTTACSGVVSCTAGSGSIGVSARDSASVGLTYTPSGAPNATGSIVATASDLAGSATDSILVRIKSYMAQVAAVGSPDTLALGANGTATFTVKNIGLDSMAYAFTGSCDNTAATACVQPSTTLVPILPSQQVTVTVPFTAGANFTSGGVMLHAYPNGSGGLDQSDSATFTVVVRTPGSLTVNTDFMNNDNQDMGVCASSCFAAQYTLSTVPFYTLGTARTTSLVYNSDRVSPRPFIYADVSPNTGAGPVQQYLLQVRKNGVNLPFTNGDDTLFFAGSSVPIRLAGQVDMSSYSTDFYPVDVMVTAVYSGGGSEMVISHTHLLVVNESNSPIAKGWTLVGPQHIYERDSVAIITDGTGSAEVFTKCGTYCYQAPTGDFSKLVVADSSPGAQRSWIRNYPDGSQLYFGTPGGDWITYDGLGRSAYIGGDTQGRVTELDDPELTKSWGSYATNIGYDSNGISWIREPSQTPYQGRMLKLGVGTDSLLYTAVASNGDTTVFTYDAQHRLSTVRNANGAVTTYLYDSVTGKLAQVTGAAVPTDAGNGSTTLQQPTAVFTPWQSVGVPKVHTSSAAPATPVEASAVVAKVKDPAGAVTQFTVDRWGQPLITTDAMGNITTITRTGMFATEVDESQGRKSYYSYEGPNLTMSQPAGDSATHYHYGVKSQVDSIWGESVVPEKRGLNSNGTVAWVRQAGDSSRTTHYAYDPVTVQVDTITDPLGHKTVLQYDSTFGNLTRTTTPSGQVISTTFDRHGRDSTSSRPGLATTTTLYDVMDRPVSVSDGVYATPTTLTYDPLGRFSVVTDPKGQSFRTEYDTAGRMTRRYDATGSGKYNSYRYDIAGRTTSSTNRRGQRIDVTYDSLGRMLTRTDVATGAVDRFPHSVDGLNFWATNANANENTEIDIVGGQSMTWTTEGGVEYINGQTTNPSFNVPDTSTVTAPTFGGTPSRRITGRDPLLGALGAVSLGGHTNTFGYDYHLGTRVSTTYVSPTQLIDGSVRSDGYARLTGLLTETSFNVASVDSVLHRAYGYDSAARLTSEQVAINYSNDGDGARQRQRQFSYDSLGRLTSVTVRRGTCMPWPSDSTTNAAVTDSLSASLGWRYTCGTLQPDSGAAFTYDSVGNRTDHGAVLSAGNRLIKFNGDTMTYDDDGNMTRRYNSATGEDHHYFWNALGQLDSVVVVGTVIDPLTGHPTITTEHYLYDANGRLVHIDGGASNDQNWFVYQGDQVSEMIQSSNYYSDVAYDDGTDRPAMVYVHGVPSDAWYSQVLDPIGNVAGVVAMDSIGIPHTWDVWGRNTSTTSDNMEVLGWKGLPLATQTGLIYMRARWYDPALGRFISEDPAGLSGGINQYAFAGDDPVNLSDPSGLFMEDPDLAQQLCEINGGTYGAFSDRSVCIAQTLATVRITGTQDDPFGGSEPVDPPPTIFGQFIHATGPASPSNDPKAVAARCTEQAVAGNALTLGLDVGAIAVGLFLPEEDMAQAAVKLGAEGGVAVVSFAHSAAQNDMPGALAALAGFQLASVEPLGNLIPYAGIGLTGLTAYRDVKKAHADYKSCVAGR